MNKILIINSLYHPNNVGGAERSVQLLAEGLKKHGVRPVIVSTADTDSTDQVNDIKVYYLRIPNAYWMRTAKQQPSYKKPFWHLLDSYNPFAAARLADIITAEKPDLIHTNNLAGFSVSTWETARKHKLPIVHTIRDHYLLCPNSTMYKNDKNCEKQCGGCRLYSIPRKRHSLHIDAVVGVSGISKLVRLSLQLGGYEAGHFRGDGLILSTATGSTAYSMASGGPILVPPMRALVLTPISPFSLSWRPMVIPDRDEIVIQVDQDQRAEVLLTIDGQESFPLKEGDVVSMSGRAGGVRVIKSDKRVFYEVVRTKLGWSGGPHA